MPRETGRIIDLRSDFLSRPTADMIAAMANAAAEPCGFLPGEHALENALQQRAAAVLGHESAIFCVTCAQANQIAINVHCRPGDALIAERTAHIITSEAGAAAALSGAMILPIAGLRGAIEPNAVETAIETGDLQKSRTSLLVMENTHVRSGGSVVSLESMRACADIARSAGIAVHLDGSRLFNAATALSVTVSELAATADSVAISLNKGLSAPQGAILAGSHDFVEQARRSRQMMGGGWRPHPVLCAAGLVALETMPQRLTEDHRRAAHLATLLADCPHVAIAEGGPQTNLVLVDIDDAHASAAAFAARLDAEGIRVLPFGHRRLRLALYHDIIDADIEQTASAIRRIAAGD